MKLKINLNHLIILITLLIFYQLYLLKFTYLLIIPGFCLLLLFTDFDLSKTLLFSLPASLILYLFPYFLITRSGLPINPYLYMLIPLLLLIIVFYKNKIKLSFKTSLKLKELIYTLTILIIFFSIYGAYSFANAVPLTAGTNGLLMIKEVSDGIRETSTVPISSNAEYTGSLYYYTYPPLGSLSVAFLALLPTEALHITYNMTYSFLYLFMLFSSYMLFKKLKLRQDASSLATAIIIGVPLLAGESTFAGNVTSPFMFCLYPIALYSFFSMLKEQKFRNLLFYSISLAGFMLVYHYNSYFMILAGIASLIPLLFISKDKKLLIRNALLFFGLTALLFSAWFIRYIALNDSLILIGWEGSWNVPLKSFEEFLSYIAATGQEEEVYKHLITFTPLFFYLGLISSLLFFRLKKGKLKILFEDKAMLFYFIALFFLIICEIFPFHTLIPMRSNYYHVFRFWEVLIPVFAFGIGRLYQGFSSLSSKGILLFPALLIIFSGMFIYSGTNVNSWLRENAIVNQSSLASITMGMPEGRVAVYGSYGPAIIPAISNWTGEGMFGGYNFQRHSTKLVYERTIHPLSEASMDFIKETASPEFIYNIYQKSFVNKILFFSCTNHGFEALNKTIQYPNYSFAAQIDCFHALIPNPLSNYAEQVTLSTVKGNKTELINQVMNKDEGYRLVFTDSELASNYYTNLLTNDSLSNYDLNSSKIDYNKVSDSNIIIHPLSSGFILVKEPYFPTWQAYQDGKGLELFPSYFGYMIIKSESGATISIINKPHYSEILGLIIYLGFIGLLFYSLGK